MNISYRSLLTLLVSLLALSSQSNAQETHHWETIIVPGMVCTYLLPTSEPDPGWTSVSFDDASWSRGSGGIGYGDDDDHTIIEAAISVYCRYDFTGRNIENFTELILDMDFDDGFVAYLNGAELARFNMGEAGSPTTWDQASDGLQEAFLYRGGVPMRFILGEEAATLLNDGPNTFAVEVHNESISSTDLSSNAFLHVGNSMATSIYRTPPEWFYPPFGQDSTQLPLLIIDTQGQPVPNEPRITALMKLVDNGVGNYNAATDPGNEYNGQISIETRGESSAWFSPKKSYSFETQLASGENNNVSLLGLPEENDWVLYAPYSDKALIRNVLTYQAFNEMGNYAPRTRFVEVVVNNEYQGIYILTEKIKRDKNRVDMAKLLPADIAGDELTGGYLLRIDKLTAMSETEYWESPVSSPISGYNRITYQYFDPDYAELNITQQNYIQDHMQEVEEAMVSGNYTDPDLGYRAYLDIPSLVDMMILNEFTKDVDGFRLSHYFYKQKDSDGGKLVNGPPWDYNLAFGNNDYTADMHETFNWIYTNPITIWWWARAMEDSWFRNQLRCRWDEVYTSVLSSDHVQGVIDSTLQVMGSSISRNYKRWPVLGVYIWPNYYVGQNYSDEVNYLRNWIDGRLEWMDSRWGGQCVPTSAAGDMVIPLPETMRVYPNPSDLSNTYVELHGLNESELHFRLFDMSGRIVYQSVAAYSGSEMAYRLPDLSYLPGGIYTLEVNGPDMERSLSKLIKQ